MNNKLKLMMLSALLLGANNIFAAEAAPAGEHKAERRKAADDGEGQGSSKKRRIAASEAKDAKDAAAEEKDATTEEPTNLFMQLEAGMDEEVDLNKAPEDNPLVKSILDRENEPGFKTAFVEHFAQHLRKFSELTLVSSKSFDKSLPWEDKYSKRIGWSIECDRAGNHAALGVLSLDGWSEYEIKAVNGGQVAGVDVKIPGGTIQAVAKSDDGKMVVARRLDDAMTTDDEGRVKTMQTWTALDIYDGETRTKTFKFPLGPINRIIVLKNGDIAAVGWESWRVGQSLWIIDAKTGKTKAKVSTHIFELTETTEGHIATLSRDGSVHVWSQDEIYGSRLPMLSIIYLLKLQHIEKMLVDWDGIAPKLNIWSNAPLDPDIAQLHDKMQKHVWGVFVREAWIKAFKALDGRTRQYFYDKSWHRSGTWAPFLS